MSEMKNSKPEKSGSSQAALPLGMCLGLSIGTAIGAMTDNIGLWMTIGLAIGVCFGSAFSAAKNKDASVSGGPAGPQDAELPAAENEEEPSDEKTEE